ncbi:MAG: hypothetical protein LQ340_000597 [Diploschistes diacapsis]|nr:MAG: hypothetical protein LQ340_000597 [Diploschistes diacapsis]
MAGLKVLINGAGIAGNAVAFWLSKLGHNVTVIERFPGLRVNGLQLDLHGHGSEVRKRIGLEHAFRSKAAPEQGLQVVDRSGRCQVYFPANKSGKGVQSITSDFEIMRRDLCWIMYDVTKDRAKYIFGTSIESFEEKGGSLEVRFDILIGAHGQGSRTRKMMLGSDVADGFRSLDECVAYFTIPRPMQHGEEYIATSYIAPGGRAVMTRRHNRHEMQVYITCRSISERLNSVWRGDVREEKKAFAKVFEAQGGKSKPSQSHQTKLTTFTASVKASLSWILGSRAV